MNRSVLYLCVVFFCFMCTAKTISAADLACPIGFIPCGKACQKNGEGSSCKNGVLTCPAGTMLCGNTCQKNLEGAMCEPKMGWICPANTFPCGKKCWPHIDGYICDGIELKCPDGLTLCGKTCCRVADGQKCKLDPTDGVMRFICPDTQKACNKICVNLDTIDNCGSCGNKCTLDQKCQERTCVKK